MKRKATLTLNLLFLFGALILSSANVKAQSTQDTNKYHDPMIMKPGYVPLETDQTTATVVTINDYDNFKLGVDFAECSVVCNPMNPKQFYAVWNSTGTAGGKGYVTNNGFDWVASNPSWTGMSGDVVVTCDSLGNLAYQNMYGTSILGSKVAMSNNFGGTWNSPVIAISGNDKNWQAADQTAGPYANNQYGTMTASSGGNHVRTTNLGVTWTNTWNFPTQSLPGMMVAVGPKNGVSGGAVYVVTNSGSSFASTYTFYESTDGGQNFNYKSAQNFANYVGSNVSGRNAVQNMRTRPYPFIAADNSFGPRRGRLYLVYASNNPSGNGNKPDIFCRYSDDGGGNWSSATRVNDDINSQNNNNWFPAVWCDKETGRIYCSWMDTRDCPTSDSALIYASYSLDGVSWTPNQKVSNKKFKINCTSCGGGGTPMYLGDYNGIASNKKVSLVAWTDFRDNNFGSYVAYFPDFAMRMEPSMDTAKPVAHFFMKVPSVKSYSDTVVVSVEIPGSSTLFTVSFPQGNTLTTFPGQVPIDVALNGSVTPGDYIMNITATGPNGTPVHKRTATVRVQAAQAPVANFTVNDNTPCETQGVSFTDLSSGPATSWQWSFPGGNPATSTAQNPSNIVYNTAGTYDVTLVATNQMGSNTLTLPSFITVSPKPSAPVSENQSVCYGLLVPDLTATGENISWYSGTQVVATGNTFTTGQTEPGTYNYTVTQTVGECSSSATPVSLTIYALPAVTFSPLDSVCVNAPAFALNQGLPAGGTYTGTGIINSGLMFDPATAGAGTHTLTYTYSNANNCVNSADQTITVKALPVVSLAPIPQQCVDGIPVALNGLPEGGAFTGTGVVGNTFDPAVAGTGTFIVTYSFTDPTSNCSAETTQQVTVNALPVLAIKDTATCGLYKITLDATIPNGQSYLWNPGGAITATLQVDTTGFGLGTRTFTVTATDLNGCSVTDNVSVSFFNCTGIDDPNRLQVLELYPNPNSGNFSLRSNAVADGNYKIKIYNSINKLVYSDQVFVDGNLFKSLTLDFLPDGVYLLRLENNAAGWTKQFVIKK